MNLNNKIETVKELLKDKKIAIAFSGGADSTLLAYLAKEVCEDVIAITVNNNLFSESFIENSKKIAENIGIKHIILEEDFFNQPDILKNDSNRCYLCRNLMYSKIIKIANEKGFDLIADGNNISDLVEDRPGIVVNWENNIFSPFIEAKVESYEIHDYLNEHNIEYCKSTTCLATRFKEEITRDKIKEIDELESIIYNNSNCKIVKVRAFDDEYIVQVENISELEDKTTFNLINDSFNKKLGKKVTLKLAEIKVNDRIILDEKEDFFMYELPYKIDIAKTKENLKDRIDQSSEHAIILKEKIAIVKTGLVTAQKLLSKEEFMDILPYIYRKV